MPASNTPKTKKNQAARIKIHNRQKLHRLPLRKLQRQVERLPSLLKKDWPPRLTRVEVVLVDELESARVHGEFMQEPAATDVITFEHGELVVCPAVAERQRHIEKLSLEDEILTYIIHGCLHLCGMEDRSENGFKRMKNTQARIRKLLSPSR